MNSDSRADHQHFFLDRGPSSWSQGLLFTFFRFGIQKWFEQLRTTTPMVVSQKRQKETSRPSCGCWAPHDLPMFL